MKEFIGAESIILVVDDEISLREIIVESLKDSFKEVLTAGDGIEALEVLKTKNVNMVITDYKMPRMNGLQLIDKMKDLFPLIPVMMLTGNMNSPEVYGMLDKGLFEIIEKPYEEKIFINRIKTSIFLNTLLKTVWDLAKQEIHQDKLEELMKMPMSQQFKVIMGYGAVLRMKANRKASMTVK
jgi:CheY-like chemotaxis protein